METYLEYFERELAAQGLEIKNPYFFLYTTPRISDTFLSYDDEVTPYFHWGKVKEEAFPLTICWDDRDVVKIDNAKENTLMSDGQTYMKMKGVDKSQPMAVNEFGGLQSKSEYAFHLIPPEALVELASVFAEGAQKYKRNNWHNITAEEHMNHMLVHMYAAVLGDTADNHLGHFLCRAVMFYHMMKKEGK